MQVNYSSSSTFCYALQIAHKHFKVAFTSNDPKSLKGLWKRQIIQNPAQPLSLLGRVKHLVLCLFECILLIGAIIVLVDRYFNNVMTDRKESISSIKQKTDEEQETCDLQINQIIKATPRFNSYAFEEDDKFKLSDIGTRPANLFYKALFGGIDPTTKPGSDKLFRFPAPLSKMHQDIFQKPDSEVMTVSAIGEKAPFWLRTEFERKYMGDKKLESVLGTNLYQISAKEIKEVLNSQRIYVSPLIPKKFYLAMKNAIDLDGIVMLPSNDNPIIMREILISQHKHLREFLENVKKDPAKYDFVENGVMLSFDKIMSLTLYQVGSMIVKAEDYYCFVDKGYRIAKRAVGEKDAIRLINTSGIRGFVQATKVPGNEQHQIDHQIMKYTFKTALQAAGEKAFIVFPAIGMGVWGGDPDIYWRAFLDAVVESQNSFQNIFINPCHQGTKTFGIFHESTGEELASILAAYIKSYPSNKNLKKIINLFDQKTDILLLAKNLKRAFPDRTIVLFNAADPDGTLGNQVGQYVNHIGHPPTTDEYFAAAGTSGLCFEGITKVREHPERIIQTV